MPRKRKSNRRKGRKRIPNKNGLNKNYVTGLVKTIPIVRLPVKRAINFAYPLYAIYNYSASAAFYSLNNSTSQISPTLSASIYANMLTNTEYLNMVKVYNLFKIDSISLTITPTNSSGSIYAETPPIFIDVCFGGAPNLTNNSVPLSDSAVEIKMNSFDSKRPTITYTMPPVLQGTSGYPLGGTQCWMPLRDFTASGNALLAFGYQYAPSFSNTSTGQSFRIGIIEVFVNCVFASPDYTE